MESYRGLHCTSSRSYIKGDYYYPSVEEINVGDDLEICGNEGFTDVDDDKSYQKITIGKQDESNDSTFPWYDELEYIADGCTMARTPLIKREDFEAEGWTFDKKNHIRSWYYIDDLFVDAPHSPAHQILAAKAIHDPIYGSIEIECKLRSDYQYHRFYEGYCRTANEFRKILRMLGIKYCNEIKS